MGKRAVKPLFEEVTARRVQTVALIATVLERSPKPKRTLNKLSDGFDVELKLVPEEKFWKRYDKRIAIKESGRQFVMNGHQITTFTQPKAPLFTTINIYGEPTVLVVNDDGLDQQRRRPDLTLILHLMAFSAIISHWAFTPLRRVTIAMNEVADGNVEHRVRDNIGPAKDAFNQMAERVSRCWMARGCCWQELVMNCARHWQECDWKSRYWSNSSMPHRSMMRFRDGCTGRNLLVSSQLQTGSFQIRPETVVLQDLSLEVLADVDFGRGI